MKTTLEMFKEIEDLDMPDGVGITVKDIVPFMCEKVEQSLHRLESIDNSNPSEALKDLERIGSDYFLGSKDCLVKKIYEKEYNNIKQALLKAQEQEKILNIIKENPFILENYFKNKGLKNQEDYDKKYFWGTITEDEAIKVQRWLEE